MLSNIGRAAKTVRVNTVAKSHCLYSTEATKNREFLNELQSQLARFEKEITDIMKPSTTNTSSTMTIESSKLSNINDIVKQLQKSTHLIQSSVTPEVNIPSTNEKKVHDELELIKFIASLTCGLVVGTIAGKFIGMLILH